MERYYTEKGSSVVFDDSGVKIVFPLGVILMHAREVKIKAESSTAGTLSSTSLWHGERILYHFFTIVSVVDGEKKTQYQSMLSALDIVYNQKVISQESDQGMLGGMMSMIDKLSGDPNSPVGGVGNVLKEMMVHPPNSAEELMTKLQGNLPAGTMKIIDSVAKTVETATQQRAEIDAETLTRVFQGVDLKALESLGQQANANPGPK
jgi:hypothetical protein